MNFVLAQSYVAAISSGLGKSSTVFLQQDVTDVAKLMSQGMAILNTMSVHTSSQKTEGVGDGSGRTVVEDVSVVEGTGEEKK